MQSDCRGARGRALSSVLAIVVAAGFAATGEGLAAPSARKHVHQETPRHMPRHAEGAPRPNPYVEFDASKMRFGSAQWWEQMRREGRLGGETP